MAKIVSPGVFTKEIDASFLPGAVAEIGACIVGPTVKGPAFIPTTVTSYSEFKTIFGTTLISGSGDAGKTYQYLTSHAAEEYLKNADKLTVVRVLAGSYSGASATISSSVDPAIVGGGVKATGSFVVASETAGGGHYGGNTADFSQLSVQSMSIGDVTFRVTGSATYINTSTLIHVVSGSDTAGAALGNISLADGAAKLAEKFRDVINNSGSTHNILISASIGATGATVGFTASYAGRIHPEQDSGSVFNGSQFSNSPSEFSSSFYMTGSNPTKTGTPATGSLFGSIIQFQGGRELGDVVGGGTSNVLGTPLFKINTFADGALYNNEAAEDENNFLSGSSKDSLRWTIAGVNQQKGTFTINIRKGNDINKRQQVLESWNNLSLDPNQPNFISKVIGDQYESLQGSGTSEPYIKINGNFSNNSKYVYVSNVYETPDYVDDGGNIRIEGSFTGSLPHFSESVGFDYKGNSGSAGGAFNGGSDGTVAHPYKFYEDITGNPANVQGFDLGVGQAGEAAYFDALNLLRNQDAFDFNLLMLPGVLDDEHTSIATKAIDVCEERGDCFVLLDPVGFNKSIPQAKSESETRDSNYAAHYWPWVQMPDNQTGMPRWVPPSVAVAGIYSFNDKIGYPWFAPAGLNRGTIDRAIQTERKLTVSDRDDLYESNVNPIASFPREGVVVWGQKTLQKKSSALDRVNVRRLMIKVKKFIASSSRFLLFEQNTVATRNSFLNIVNPYLDQVRSKSGLNEFRVIMDESNNTPDVIDRNILYGQIFVQPTKTAEFILLDFTVQPTGATFSDQTSE